MAIDFTIVLFLLAGAISLVGVRDPHRRVSCEDCAGGAIVGAPEDAARPMPVLRMPRPAGARS